MSICGLIRKVVKQSMFDNRQASVAQNRKSRVFIIGDKTGGLRIEAEFMTDNVANLAILLEFLNPAGGEALDRDTLGLTNFVKDLLK